MPVEIIQKIDVQAVRVSPKTVWWHVIVITRSGLSGLGEATIGAPSVDFADQIRRAGAVLVGQCPSAQTMLPLHPLLGGGLQSASIYSALEQAVVDLEAQLAGVPIATFVAETSAATEINHYANINRTSVSREPKEFALNATQAVSQGFKAIKIAPFDDLTPALCDTDEGRSLINAGFNRIAAVSEKLCIATLMIDCHWRFTPAAVEKILPRLAELNVVWLECPYPEIPKMIRELAALRRQTTALGMRLAGLESFAEWERFAPYAKAGAYDVIMPDIKHAGGYRAISRIAKEAHAAGIACSLHNPTGPVAHLASVHMAAAMGGDELLEYQWNESPMFFQLTNPAPVFDNGKSAPSAAAGLGTTLTEVAKTAAQMAGNDDQQT